VLLRIKLSFCSFSVMVFVFGERRWRVFRDSNRLDVTVSQKARPLVFRQDQSGFLRGPLDPVDMISSAGFGREGLV
jgi:hypothetical protein